MPIRPTINPPVVIIPVKPSELHQWWPFIERGLFDICRKVHPDWIPPDVFGAIRADAAKACIVMRGIRALGFFIYHPQNRPWSGILDLFVWATWALPLRERLPADGMAEAIQRGIEYLHEIKRSLAAQRIIAISSRRAFTRRYGFKTLFQTLEITDGYGRGEPDYKQRHQGES